MTHKLQTVKAKDNYTIEAVFFDGTAKLFDMKKLFDRFSQFKLIQNNEELFQSVKVDVGGYGISWNDDLDLDAETIWDNGIVVEWNEKPAQNYLLAYHLSMARERAGMTQKELSEKTGIYQADISKIERGIGNPSLSTLTRLADGMGMELKIDFV